LAATGWTQESLAFLDAAVQLLHVRGAVCWYTVLLEHKVVTRHFAYLKREAAVSKRYHQNFLLCNNNEITHALQLFL